MTLDASLDIVQTLNLGACTKAANSADRRKQPFSNELAKPRAFSFKSSYMTYVEYYGGRNHNNFPKSTENRVCHVRPHAQNASDTYELPDGRMYPKQCFWLNNSYINTQIRE